MIKTYFLQKTSNQSKIPLKLLKSLLSLLILICGLHQMNAQNIGAVWATQSTGTLDGVGFTLTGSSGPTLAFDLSTAAYSGAPLSSSQTVTQVQANTQWSVTFNSPVTNPRVYFVFYQVGTATFNVAPTFLSGINLSTAGNDVIMSAPAGNNHHGVVEFTGTHTTITITGSTVSSGGSAITFGLVDPALPAALTSFGGEAKKRMVQLSWQTERELNNERFEIESSTTGAAFEKVGEVAGSGTTSEQKDYTFDVRNPRNGLTYYRLKQINYDGHSDYSETISIDFENSNEQVGDLYPNPTTSGLVNVDYTSETTETIDVLVFDVAGKSILSQSYSVSSGGNNLTLNLSGVEKGVYFVRLDDKKSSTYRKLVVE